MPEPHSGCASRWAPAACADRQHLVGQQHFAAGAQGFAVEGGELVVQPAAPASCAMGSALVRSKRNSWSSAKRIETSLCMGYLVGMLGAVEGGGPCHPPHAPQSCRLSLHGSEKAMALVFPVGTSP